MKQVLKLEEFLLSSLHPKSPHRVGGRGGGGGGGRLESINNPNSSLSFNIILWFRKKRASYESTEIKQSYVLVLKVVKVPGARALS